MVKSVRFACFGDRFGLLNGGHVFEIFLVILFLFPLKLISAKVIAYSLYIIFLLISRSFKAKRDIVVLLVIIYFLVLAQFIHGLIIGNEGVWDYVLLYLVSPLFYLFIFFMNSDSKSIRIFYNSLSKVVLVVSCVILYELLSVLFSVSFFPLSLISDFYEIRVQGEGLIEISSHFLVLIQFFFVSTAVQMRFNLHLFKSKSIVFIGFLLSTIILLLSGKTGVYLTILPFLVTWLFSNKWSVMISFLCVFIIFYGFKDDLRLILDFYSLYSESHTVEVRVNQYHSLLSGIRDNPVFGAGIGGYTFDRNIFNWSQPWAYELQYLAHMFHFGLPVFLFFILSYVYLWHKALRLSNAMKNESAFLYRSLLLSVLSILLLNAINPVISKFDFIWIFFVPLWIYNSIRVQYKRI